MMNIKYFSCFLFILLANKPFNLKRVNIPLKNIIELPKYETLNECKEACTLNEECNSYEYNEQNHICILSNATHFSDELKTNSANWDIYTTYPGQ